MGNGTEKMGENDISRREEEILAFWKERDIFKKTGEKPAPKGEFVFYEGPPTANGRPGIHHVLARAFKDIIPRFRTMQGYHVRRKGGWDTHGLPVELQVEKELGLSNKKDIEAYGIAAFNKKCKESVWKYVDEWKRFTQRIAFWVDLDNAYVTYTPSYIESLWFIVAHIHKRGLLYKDYKVVPWCPRCGTALSSHELAQGYAEVDSPSVYVKFKVKNPEKLGLSGDVFLLAWTTTPWTLPGNVALAVGKDVEYLVHTGPLETIIVAIEAQKRGVLGELGNIKNTLHKGSDLIGLEYEPLFPFLKEQLSGEEKKKLDNAYRVYAADFVTTEDGTGIVHTAVMYGADDFALGTAVGLPRQHLVGEDGRFLSGTGFLEGKFVKDADKDIIAGLVKRNSLFKEETVRHTYPFCWRCTTPLLYYARDSWYVRMSSLRDELLAENEKIHWEPEYIKRGRFGEWLAEVKDWAVSRERYWGTPLPVWGNGSDEWLIIGSLEELRKHTKKSGNRYFVMRHGEAEYNTKGILNADLSVENSLTERGKEQVRSAVSGLLAAHVDIVVHSPLPRTKETATLLAEKLGLTKNALVEDARLSEVMFGEFEGKTIGSYHSYFEFVRDRMTDAPKGGETWNEVKRRIMELLYEYEQTYAGKTIVLISHNGPLQMLRSGALGLDVDACGECISDDRFDVAMGAVLELPFVPLPHNEEYELDLHRPFIDNLRLVDEKGEPLTRTPEVMDVWFDSGAMPFAQDHYPFENKEWVESVGYPADYISEAIDQTRGWFYTLHAVGSLMERGRAYKNVISLGHILDREGKKMSKSIGNVVDPWEMIERYGADALRMWMYTVNQPGDSKNFDERSVDEVVKKTLRILENVYSFYVLYAAAPLSRTVLDRAYRGLSSIEVRDPRKSPSILDQWILASLDKLINTSTKHLETYRIFEPARAIREFILDLSQWYVRRSRDRFKNEGEDKTYAVATLRLTLLELSKVMAPFTPLFAERLYQDIGGEKESVHLEGWPCADTHDPDLLAAMDFARSFASTALKQRAEAKIKVRQPLPKLSITHTGKVPKYWDDVKGILADEINVKEVVLNVAAGQSEPGITLDTMLTPELKDEGAARDLIRHIQDMRKKMNLAPNDVAILIVDTNEAGKNLFQKFEDRIKKTTLLGDLKFTEAKGDVVRIGDHTYCFHLIRQER